MKQHHLKIIMFVLVVLVALPQLAQAINLGSAAKNNLVNLGYSGVEERAEFTLLFWTRDSQSFPVLMSFDNLPQGWFGHFDPKQFNLPPSENTETVVYEGGTVVAKAVKVVLKAPPFADRGRYEIVVRALAGNSDGDLAAQQERIFRLYVVIGNYNSPVNQNSQPQIFNPDEQNNFSQKTESTKPLELNKIVRNPNQPQEETSDGSSEPENNLFTGMFSALGHLNLFWVGILSAIITACAIIVYKKWGDDRYY